MSYEEFPYKRRTPLMVASGNHPNVKVEYEPCEKVSGCCDAPWNFEDGGKCSARGCGNGTTFFCLIHDVEWPDAECPKEVQG